VSFRAPRQTDARSISTISPMQTDARDYFGRVICVAPLEIPNDSGLSCKS
jgi:hypothetical protein